MKTAVFAVVISILLVSAAHSQAEEQVGIVEGLCGISEIIASSFLYLFAHPIEACHLCFELSPGDFYEAMDDVLEVLEVAYEPLLPEMVK